MGFVSELYDLFGKYAFYAIVHEYEQGLYFRNGVVLERTVNHSSRELEEIVKEENKVKEQGNGTLLGKLYWMFPFTRPEIPSGYSRSFWTGLPLHEDKAKVDEILLESTKKGLLGYANKMLNFLYWMNPFSQKKLPDGWKRGLFGPRHAKRYLQSKVLSPGLYFHFPVVDKIVIDFKKEKVLNLGNVTVPTMDKESRVVILSCNMRYEMLDFNKAYNKVHNYEDSLKAHTLSLLARSSRGRSYEDFKNPLTVSEIEKSVLVELQKKASEWGLTVHDIYITDNVSCVIQRVMYEGNPLVVPAGNTSS